MARIGVQTIATEHDMEYLCDELCRHPRECKKQQELDEICEKCPFAAKMEGDEWYGSSSRREKNGCRIATE